MICSQKILRPTYSGDNFLAEITRAHMLPFSFLDASPRTSTKPLATRCCWQNNCRPHPDQWLQNVCKAESKRKTKRGKRPHDLSKPAALCVLFSVWTFGKKHVLDTQSSKAQVSRSDASYYFTVASWFLSECARPWTWLSILWQLGGVWYPWPLGFKRNASCQLKWFYRRYSLDLFNMLTCNDLHIIQGPSACIWLD